MPMTSLERVKTAINHKEPDIVPVGPYMGNHGAQAANVSLKDYYTNGRVMADAQYKAWELYGQDIVVPQSDGYYIAEGFGAVTEYRIDSTPTVKKHAINNLFEVCKLKVPDPSKDGRMPVYLEAIQLLSQKLKCDVCVRATGTGPFSLASHLIGIDNFLNAILDAEYGGDSDTEKAIHDLLHLATQATASFALAALEAGANIVQAGDSLASLDMISPSIYEKYAFPYEKAFFDEIRPYKEKKDAAALLHICGNTTKIINLLAQTGADILEVDYKVDLAYCKRQIGDRICLMGNLNPAGNLLSGKPEDVAKEAVQCIQKAGKNGGFILGSGCEVAIHTPVENLKAMIKVAGEHKYPLS